MGSLRHGLLYALRTLRVAPAFTFTAVLLLALGTGINAAVFSVLYEGLLRPLPYPQPNRLVQLVRSGQTEQLSMPEYEFARDHAASFEEVAAYRPGNSRSVEVSGQTETVSTILATASLFHTIGIAPAFGRIFESTELTSGGPRAAILTSVLAGRIYSSAPAAIGRTIVLDDVTYTIVGVMPSSFWFPADGDILLPLESTGAVGDLGANTTVIGRLKQGSTQQAANAELATLRDGLYSSNQTGLSNNYPGLSAEPYRDKLSSPAERTTLFLLFGAVGLFLLIACSNVSSLLLARASARRKEFAVRLALGSSQGRLLLQYTLENVVLVLVGGIAGWMLGTLTLAGFVALLPFDVMSSKPLELSVVWLVSACAVVLLVNLALTAPWVWRSTRLSLIESLTSRTRVMETRLRTRTFLVGIQSAAAVVLSAAAILLGQTLYQLGSVDLGFASSGIVTFTTPLSPAQRSNPALLRQLQSDIPTVVSSLPGVRSVAGVNILPLTGVNNFPTQHAGHPEHSIGGMEIRIVTPGYFESMGIRLLSGRGFDNRDAASTKPVIVVSERVAKEWWGSGSPLGDAVSVGQFQGKRFGNDANREVVGVVADAKTLSPRDPTRAMVYLPAAQAEPAGMSWVVQGEVSAGVLQDAVSRIIPGLRVDRVRPIEDLFSRSVANPRFNAWTFIALAMLALLLTAVGLYGLIAFSVVQRTQEIGIRMAVGATPGNIARMILRNGLRVIVAGGVIGLLAARAGSGLLSSLLFGVQPANGLSYGVAAALLLTVSVGALYIPARKAAALNPSSAIRRE